jgi:hypothetical protein
LTFDRYGKLLIDACSAFRNADDEIAELTLRIRNCWKKTTLQLGLVRRVWQDLDAEHQAIQMELLTSLNAKLLNSATKISSCLDLQYKESPEKAPNPIPKPTFGKRFKYAVLKGCLNKAITEMELWQKLFDPTWFLLARTTAPHVDEEIQCSSRKNSSRETLLSIRDVLKACPQQSATIFLPADGLELARTTSISFSTVKLVQRVGSSSWLLVDAVASDVLQSLSQRKQIVRDLATRLSRADPSKLALLTAVGAIDKRDKKEFEIVFKTPAGMSNPTNKVISSRFQSLPLGSI